MAWEGIYADIRVRTGEDTLGVSAKVRGCEEVAFGYEVEVEV